MIFCSGNRGKSKSPVRLSADLRFGRVVFHVMEGGRITHTFTADDTFMQAIRNYYPVQGRSDDPALTVDEDERNQS